MPLGWLGTEGVNKAPSRPCNLTRDEQLTLMSLWTIFRSPLVYGGDWQHPDAWTLSLLTNPEALAITDHSTHNAYLTSNTSLAVWRADSEGWQEDGRSYFTVHNLRDEEQRVEVRLEELRGGQQGATQCVLRDVWARADVGKMAGTQAFTLRPHASLLYALHNCTAAVKTAVKMS